MWRDSNDGLTASTSTLPLRQVAPYLLAYLLGVVLAHLAGWRMVIPYFYYQILSKQALTDRLGESLLYLHSQPPLLNLLLGLTLKIQRSTSVSAESLLLAIQLALGAVSVVALFALLEAMALTGWGRALVMGLVLSNPALYYYLLGFFYPLYEQALLCLLALSIHRFLTGPSLRNYLWASVTSGLLVYTRSLFHFSWALASLLALALLGARLDRRHALRRSQLAVTFSLAVAVLLTWPTKNLLLFGTFSYSSWQGYNFSQGLPVRGGELAPMFRSGNSDATLKARALAAKRVPARFESIPVLADPTKEPGVPNWNHYAMLQFSRRLGSRALVALREDPSWLAKKATTNYLGSYTQSASRNPRTHQLWRRSGSTLEHAWQRLYEIVVFQPLGKSLGATTLTGFAAIFPIVILGSLFRLLRNRRKTPATAATVGFLLFSVLWVLAMVLFVDGVEGNRMRLATQPLIFVCALWAFLPRAGANANGGAARPGAGERASREPGSRAAEDWRSRTEGAYDLESDTEP